MLKKINNDLRERLSGISQTSLVIKSGVNQPALSLWQRGSDLTYAQLLKLADAFGYDIFMELRVKVEG